MTIHDLMQKWEFNYIIPFEYNSVEELVQNSDGTLLSLLAAKCHIPHKDIMYANCLWASEGEKWFRHSHYREINQWVQNGIKLGESDSEIYQSDYVSSSFAVAQVFNAINEFHSVSGNNELHKKDMNEFLQSGGNVYRNILGTKLITLLNNAINQ